MKKKFISPKQLISIFMGVMSISFLSGIITMFVTELTNIRLMLLFFTIAIISGILGFGLLALYVACNFRIKND